MAAKKTATASDKDATKATKLKVGFNEDYNGLSGVGLSATGTKKANTMSAVLPLKSIRVCKGMNPRTDATVGIEDLTASIKRDGLLHPIVVRPSTVAGRYDIVAGERRFHALALLERTECPVTVRYDLTEDADANAVAVAENSEDGRVNLNYIEMGRVFAKLESDAGWSTNRIASACGVGTHTVRRALKVMEAPKDVQQRVSDGTLSSNAALEYAKLDSGVRSKIKDELEVGTTAKDIRLLGKKAAKDAGAEAAAGTKANKQTGTKRDAALVTWEGSKAKQAQIKFLCHIFLAAESDSEIKGSTDYHELRGSIAYALWDRGDLDSPVLPDPDYIDADKGKTAIADAKKTVKMFMAVVKAEAAKYEPEVDDADGEPAE